MRPEAGPPGGVFYLLREATLFLGFALPLGEKPLGIRDGLQDNVCR
ncbi:hypothetical protein [Methylobacterium nigriterrae]